MKSSLITGGLGFIGSHLADRLLSEGRKVVIVDNLQTNVVDAEHFANRCEVICKSVEETEQLLAPGPGRAFDEIYHLASVVGPAGVLRHAGDIARSIVNTGDIACKWALQHGARLVLASTSEVYGRTGCLKEDLDCLVSPNYTVRLEYAAAKLTSEIALLNKAKVSNLFVNVVRPFNVAGPRQLPDGGFVLPRFVVSALTDTPLTVFGDGTQIRAFTDVRDIVAGLIASMRTPSSGMVFNLGNSANEISIWNLANTVVKVSGTTSNLELVDPKILFGTLYEEGIERIPNALKAREILGWEPQFSLEQTVNDTLEFFRSRPDLLKNHSPQMETAFPG